MNPWNAVLSKLENELSPDDFKTWFAPSSYVSHGNDNLTIRVPNKLFRTVIKDRFGHVVESAMQNIGGGATYLEIVHEEDEQPVQQELPLASTQHDPALNSRYTFRTFVVGKSNEFANAAALSVVDEPGVRYNPLFLYGGVGLGKTHMMQAVGNELLLRHQNLKILYLTSEYFMNELVAAIRYDRIHQFRSKYRNIDVLLVDDIQFLANKERTQEEFFHTFNALYNSRKQIILSSDCQPRDIPTLEERLTSRFEWGLIADIQPPDLETKIAILHKKAELENAVVPEEVMLLIASRVRSNIRELEGCLIRLIFYSSLTGKPISLSLAEEALSDMLEPKKRNITVSDIQDFIAKRFEITAKELVSKSNRARISLPRQIAMYLTKKLTDLSLPEIGRQFGGKHHSTVLHSIRKIEDKRLDDNKLNSTINDCLDALS
jgi:chromosomal replication initiator protein